jgi:hypothetical protein
MDERKKWKTVNNTEGGKNYRNLRNKFKRAKKKKQYFHRICDVITEFQRSECHDLTCKKTKKLCWKENQGTQNIGTEDSQGNITADLRKIRNIWENYITELYDRANGPEKLKRSNLNSMCMKIREALTFCTVTRKKLLER